MSSLVYLLSYTQEDVHGAVWCPKCETSVLDRGYTIGWNTNKCLWILSRLIMCIIIEIQFCHKCIFIAFQKSYCFLCFYNNKEEARPERFLKLQCKDGWSQWIACASGMAGVPKNVHWRWWGTKQSVNNRHRILYNSSESQKWESTGFQKNSMFNNTLLELYFVFEMY